MDGHHDFILHPGRWVGEGTVSFSASPDQLFFVTTWNVKPADEEGIQCEQEVKMEGAEEASINHFLIGNLTKTAFDISLENEAMGQVEGAGVIDERTIAWEFQGKVAVQGYEVYERHKDGEYSFHAEYSSPDHLRTIIDGRIRKQEVSK